MLPLIENKQPLVSIVMNCLNGQKYLREAINSIFSQTYTNWEIIFWDNASTDNSSEIVKSYQDKRIRYFRGDKTVPLGHARNLALRNSSGDFIAFLDCDDIWIPEKLSKQIPLFLADNDVGIVYSDTFFFNEDGVENRLLEKKKPYRGYCFDELLNNYLISLETAVIRKSVLDSLNQWFDEKFNMVEEYDLFVRIGIKWKVDFVPDALAKWRVHSESWSWKYPDSLVDETETMLNQLIEDSFIAQKYSSSLNLAKNSLKFKQAVQQWRNGSSKEARKIIRQIPSHTRKLWVLWIISYLPCKIIEPIYKFLSNTIRPVKKIS
ncbi:MAG: glycosyltransferase [Deltaproteobacteria bacterium]|nr:MAG: glycosyltransferase [Deltaproteobacteria bacterium]